MQIQKLIARQPRPWQINVPPPRDRFFEVMYHGTRLTCAYDSIAGHWTIGTDTRIEREEITHWRELSCQQLAVLETLTRKN